MSQANGTEDLFPSYKSKVEEFRGSVEGASSVLILTHDYPDPDCLAAALGIYELISFWGIKSAVISFGGFVGRAENRAMIRYLNIRTVPFVLTEVNDFDRIILVDSYPGKGNVSLSPSIPAHAVIDHHPNKPDPNVSFFYDIRSNVGATSTMITKYLLEAGCPISPKLATALFYGIKTDTGDMKRDVAVEDGECYRFLFDIMEHKLLSKIENPDRDIEYFRILHRATEAATYYDTLGYTHLGSVSTPDYIAEMADLFHSLERLEWMICSGVFKNQIFYSIRSKNLDTAGINAEKIAKIYNGSGGGHARVAAGRIPYPQNTSNNVLNNFVITLQEVFGITNIPEEKLL